MFARTWVTPNARYRAQKQERPAADAALPSALPVPLPKNDALAYDIGGWHCNKRPLADDYGLSACAFQTITIKARCARRLGPLPLIGGLDARLMLLQLPS